MPYINIILFLLPLFLKLISWLESLNFNPSVPQRRALAALLNYTSRFGDACHNRGLDPLTNGEMIVALDDLHNMAA